MLEAWEYLPGKQAEAKEEGEFQEQEAGSNTPVIKHLASKILKEYLYNEYGP